jgi:hypothetical protein
MQISQLFILIASLAFIDHSAAAPAELQTRQNQICRITADCPAGYTCQQPHGPWSPIFVCLPA